MEGGGFDLEEGLADVVQVLVLVVEACGAAVIIIGAVWAFLRFVVLGLRRSSARGFVPVRLTLGRFLALGLEFQLASDILSTAVAPSWEELGKLAAVAAIRTGLNYFLAKEIAEERRQVEEEQRGEGAQSRAGTPAPP
ncbi:DUF1622 domain-containing protein [Quadrisphaera sp. DSM 44207]|uniref:DUF1622 domain-containing protein n=1 Tax=Quadrisphaera sp. DSM 44207 TaxID=1881057 RepID=UPI00088CEDC4|nr:DUF1622 domain-containing protein [Quadrisphaera sp. DSM 44207]SDQ10881.1 Uncharacterized membrane protein [Quadrisphaera sp. DSM 44207]